MAPELEIVIPAYNESASLAKLIGRYASAAQAAGFSSKDFQLIVVNNGSTDRSSAVLNELQKGPLKEWFRVATVETNVGYGHGLFTGLCQTQAPVVGISHADEQCAPEDVFRAYAVLEKKPAADMLVKGVRRGRNWKDIVVSRLFEFLARVILGLNAFEINAQPKIFPRALLGRFKNPPHHFAFDLYVLYQAKKAGFQIKTITVDFPPRIHGASRWAATFLSRNKTILGQIKYMGSLLLSEGRVGH